MENQAFFNPTLPSFFSIFLTVYFLGYFIVFRNWNPKHRAEATSCFMSLFHGTPAAVLATTAIIQTQSSSFASPNSPFQNTVLDYSIAYFFMDLLHYLLLIPSDVLFILHHLATLYVFLTCRFVVQHGAFALLGLLVLAEITSPCQNVWSLAGFRRQEVPAAGKLYESLSPPFFTFYSFVRGILGPLFVYKMGRFYGSGLANGLIPVWAWVSWMVVIVAAILVSILWVWNHWVHWYKRRNYKAPKKVM
ncbi:hypothetical protein SLEP1_g25530 [Rubroshorea leprosula]|uniref:TLC domain-containing protein n=1 Tax=Rubroshorea leprosula TaxID=152421 RepID=A0AAV5JQE5_9ROSI|nr:hypothetical protein SLEP1_g25530 [Rubroshorea leprosula]